MKWLEINTVEITMQDNIFVLSLNWKERMSTQMAIPIRICDKKKLESNIRPIQKYLTFQLNFIL